MKWRARISPSLVILAVCARPFAAAAAGAGYQVAALDVFNDVETRRLCFYSAQVGFSQGAFDADDLWCKLDIPELSGASVVYGSGFESQPELLDRIAGKFNLLGNDAATVAKVKDPHCFFPLLEELGIAHPETLWDKPPEDGGWLSKRIGGSGGTHIQPGTDASGSYYQRRLEGIPLSVLFLANGTDAEIVGYNEQWLAPAPDMPYRYGGAVGNADMPDETRRVMAEAVHKVVAATGLRGLNSMDFLLFDQMPLALEINPRLSASFELYEMPDLFERHVLSCDGELNVLTNRPAHSKAHLIHYASRDFRVDGTFAWPAWTTDIPPVGTDCRSGEPLCTVLAQGPDASSAKTLAFARAVELEAQLRGHFNFPGKS